DAARQRCQAGIRPGKRKGRAGPNEVRHMMSKMWKQATPAEREPYYDKVAEAKKVYAEKLAEYERLAAEWDEKAAVVRLEYEKDHPFAGTGVKAGGDEWEAARGPKHRRVKQVSYAEVSDESEGSA